MSVFRGQCSGSRRGVTGAAYAGRLYDRLIDRFGQGQVFMDVDPIPPGLGFVEVIQGSEAVGKG